MFFDQKVLGVYGTKKPFGKTCVFVDATLNVTKKHFLDKQNGWGVHGCSNFIEAR